MISVVSGALLFWGLGEYPIYIWDEGRIAINALEMMGAQNPLITTYHGAPDLYNTKPPLAIWLQALSMSALGPSEWSLRLPSAVAALATVLMVYAFARRVSGLRGVGILAALVLLGTPGYVGVHIARTADYEALLILFTTATIFAGWLAIEGEGVSRARWLWVAGLATGLACLTKGVSGIMLLPGLVIYAACRSKVEELVRSRAAWGAALVAVAMPLAFYLVREASGPGYLKAVWEQELGGRYAQHLADPKPWDFYFSELFAPWPADLPGRWIYITGSAFPWCWAAPLAAMLALKSTRNEVRRCALMILSVSGLYLAVITLAATKLSWYAAPILPLLAVLVALGFRSAREGRFSVRWRAAAFAVALAFVALVFVRNGVSIWSAEFNPETRVALAEKRLFEQHPLLSPVRVLRDPHAIVQSAPLRGPEEFYAAVQRLRGLDVRVVDADYKPSPGETLLWCERTSKADPAVRGLVTPVSKVCRLKVVR